MIFDEVTDKNMANGVDWTPEGGSSNGEGPSGHVRIHVGKDVQEMGVSGSDTHEARSIASDHAQWRQLVAQCSSRDRRT